MFLGFVDFMLFMIFWEGKKMQKTKQNEKIRKHSAEIKRKVREAYLSATMGGRCWVYSYTADAVDGVQCW